MRATDAPPVVPSVSSGAFSIHARRRTLRRLGERFAQARRADAGYGRNLRQVARQIEAIIRGLAPDGVVDDLAGLTATLGRYGELLTPWARAVAGRMLEDVSRRDARAWAQHGREMGQSLRQEIEHAPIGALLKSRLDDQVELITSLPREAAQRVHELTIEARSDSTRASEIARDILNSGDVTAARATLIARTETSRTAALLTETRAQHVGSTHYRWMTAGDADVRPSHRALHGKIFRWDEPPEVTEGEGRSARIYRFNPGGIFNCRCWAYPLLPDEPLA